MRKRASCLALFSGLVLSVAPCLSVALRAANRLYFDDVTLAAGAQGEDLYLMADTDVVIRGFSFGVKYDPSKVGVTSVERAGVLASLESEEIFFDGRLDPDKGLIGYGCVVDRQSPIDEVIPPGAAQPLARLKIDVKGPGGTITQLSLETVAVNPAPSPPVKNIMTDSDGLTLRPTLKAGQLTIEDRRPRIARLEGNEGKAGQVFRIVGSFFGEPGLTVTVCDVGVSASLEPDGQTLVVTAPDCQTVGFAGVEVCTARGCDREPNGFNYTSDEKTFVRGNSNGDGNVDISDGITVLLYLFVGNQEPTCLDALDANDSGVVDLSDAVFIFNFLFLGGDTILPPYPESGVDPTPDEIAPCQ